MSLVRAGLTLGFSLIISLGPQNMFLIRQGLKREHAYLAAFVCLVCDVFLVILSTTGVSSLIIHYPMVKNIMLVLGVLFLGGYGLKSIISGVKSYKSNQPFQINDNANNIATLSIVLTAISFSLLNPQAIIDTMIMIGGVVSQYPQQDHFMLVLGVLLASFLWFYGITTISRSFAPYLRSGRIWACLELISGIIMLGFGAWLLSLLT